MNDDIDDATSAFDDADIVEGFEPAVSATGSDVKDASLREAEQATPTPRARRRSLRRPASRGSRAPRTGLRRKLGAAAALTTALAVMGVAYASFAGSSGASDTGTGADQIAAGHQLYQTSCITCHGANLDGVTGQGPSLVGVGGAAVYFQVITGRMPAAGQGAYEPRKAAKFTEEQTNDLAAYVESIGGGPTLPSGDLQSGVRELGTGGELYRLNCASCHGVTGKGAPLAAGAYAPSLNDATDKVMYAAMLSGPENMPVFANNQITPIEKKQIIAYVQTMKASADPGGSGIDRIGPVSEAIVLWVAGVGVLMIAILWIGARVR